VIEREMFENTSRYNDIDDAIITVISDIRNTKHGNKNVETREIKYKKRRILPIQDTDNYNDDISILQQVVVKAWDRLDNIAASTLGDPEQFWRICDANNAMYPPELTNEPGKTIIIKAPWT